MADREQGKAAKVRVVGVAGLVCFAVGLVAAFGWGNHWNAYTNLSLSLGDIVLWVTLAKVVRHA